MLLINPLSALAISEIAERGKHRATVSTAAASALGGMVLRLGKRHKIPVIQVVRRQECAVDARTTLLRNLHFDGWFLGNWMRKKNLLQVLQLSGQAQSLLGNDLQSPIHKRFPLADAQKGLETYRNHMSAGKILLVANPQEVTLDG